MDGPEERLEDLGGQEGNGAILSYMVANNEGQVFDFCGDCNDELFGDGERVVYFKTEWFLFCPPLRYVR